MTTHIANVFVILPHGSKLHHTIDEYGDFAMKTRCGLDIKQNKFTMVHPQSIAFWGNLAPICKNCKRRKHRDNEK